MKTVKVKWSRSVVSHSVSPWTIAHRAPPSMEFSRQEYWSGLPFPSPGGLPDPGIEPRSPALQANTLPSEPPGKYPHGLTALCAFPLTHIGNPRHQISNHNLEWYKPSFLSLLYSSQILFEDTTCMHFHARYYVK